MAVSHLLQSRVFGYFWPPYQVDSMKLIATKLLFLEGPNSETYQMRKGHMILSSLLPSRDSKGYSHHQKASLLLPMLRELGTRTNWKVSYIET